MDSRQAREILASYRPNTDDAQDPAFAEALAQVRRDPELARWFSEQQAVDTAWRAKFGEIPVPAGLRDRILASQKVVQLPVPARRSLWIGLAAAAAVIGLLTAWLFLREPPSFETYRDQMARLVTSDYKMMLESKDPAAIREFLASHHAPADYVLTPALAKLPTEGCALIHWHGKKVALVCLDLGQDNDLFLFVSDRTDVNADACQQFATVGPMATATWTKDNKTYLLAFKGTADQLRKYL